MSVVVSGAGLVTAYGTGTARYWRALLDGKSALGAARRFDVPEASAAVVAECLGLPPDQVALAGPAVTEALAEAAMDRLPERSLVITVAQAPPPADPDPSVATFSGLDPTKLAELPDSAEFLLLSHACASVGFAVLLGSDWLAAGLTDAVLIVGATVLNRWQYASMAVVRALSGTGVRPFDLTRDGTCLGEGAGALLLERSVTVEARGARPLATVAGGNCRIGSAAGAAADVDASAACLAAALAAAGRHEVDRVQAHATGTPQGDATEWAALVGVGREHEWRGVPISADKGAVGHLMHAAGFPAVTAALRSIAAGVLPGTPGLAHPIPDASPVRLVRRPQPGAVRSVLVSSSGFGGNLAAIVLTDVADR